MFVPPPQVTVDKSGGCFSSNRINTNLPSNQVINPKTTLGSGAEILNLLPVEQDSFASGFLKGLNATLAKPVTMTTGRDKLATVDPYKKVVETPQNQLASILSSYFGTPGVILGGIVENESLRKMTSELIRTGKVDSETSKAYLSNFKSNVLGGITEGVAPWLDTIKDDIGLEGVNSKQLVSSILGVKGSPRVEDVLQQNPTIAMVVKGKEYWSNADFSTTNGLFKVIDNITNNNAMSTLLDLKTEFSIFNTVTKSVMAFDDESLYTKLGDWFKSSPGEEAPYDRETLYYLDNLDNAIDTSSLTYLEVMLKTVPPSKILDENRNFVSDFLNTFRLRYDQEPTAEMGKRLDDLMTQIDPNWAKAQLIPGKTGSYSALRPFKTMSDDAERVFTVAGLYETEMVIANYYPVQPMETYMKALYPYVML